AQAARGAGVGGLSALGAEAAAEPAQAERAAAKKDLAMSKSQPQAQARGRDCQSVATPRLRLGLGFLNTTYAVGTAIFTYVCTCGSTRKFHTKPGPSSRQKCQRALSFWPISR